MSLRYAIVGLLAAKPRSGYDLAREFRSSLQHVWNAKSGQIYPELAKLMAAGLIRERDAEPQPRGRRVYEATEAGLEEVRAWLRDTEPDRSYRHEAMLRSFFLWLLDDGEARGFLEREAEYHRRVLRTLEEIAASVPARADNVTPSAWIPLEWGVRFEREIAEWAEWAAAQIEVDSVAR